jgi:hypothetical protein
MVCGYELHRVKFLMPLYLVLASQDRGNHLLSQRPAGRDNAVPRLPYLESTAAERLFHQEKGALQNPGRGASIVEPP